MEMVVGLYVIDDEKYANYREAMAPLLKAHQGGFGYDFTIAKVLKSRTDAPINRVFTIYFGSTELMKSFFAHEEYLAIKKQFFEGSVTHTTIIAQYERD